MTKTKVLLLCAAAVGVLLLCSCSADVGDTHLEGPAVLWKPFLIVWEWLWNDFTPNFWDKLSDVWDLPLGISWLAGTLTYILGACLYLMIIVVIIVVDIVLAVLTALIYYPYTVICAIFS